MLRYKKPVDEIQKNSCVFIEALRLQRQGILIQDDEAQRVIHSALLIRKLERA
jgi:hypothetical protein